MTRLPGFAAAVALVLFGGAKATYAEQAGYYISGDGGVSLLPDLHLTDTGSGTLHEQFDTGYALGGAAGYDNGAGDRIELDTLYTRSDLKSIGGVSAGGNLAATGLIANAQMDLTHGTQFTPYVGAGVGFQYIDAHLDGLGGDKWRPAYQAETGLRDDISDKVSLFGEYRFSQSEAADLAGGGLSGHQHFADNGVLAGLTFRLGD